MNFRLTGFRMPLLAGALTALCWSAVAQNGAPPASKPILFSAPVGDHAVSNTAVAAAATVGPAGLCRRSAGARVGFQHGKSIRAVTPPAPSRAPMLSRAEAQRLQELQDKRENWALLTPEEILGMDSSRNTLRTPEQEARRWSKKPDRRRAFFAETAAIASGGHQRYGDNSLSSWDFSGNPGGSTNGDSLNPVRFGLPTTAQILDRFFNNPPANNQFAGQR